MMTRTLTLTECYEVLDVDPKTFRQWIKREGIEPDVSATDSRIKCLTMEQVQHIATVHGRVLKPLPAERARALQGTTLSLAERIEDTKTDVLLVGTRVEELQKHLLCDVTPSLGMAKAQIGSFIEETTIALQHLEVAFTTLHHALIEGETHDKYVQVPQENREHLVLHQLTALSDMLRRQEQSGLEKLAQIEAQIAQTQEQVATLVLKEIQALELRYEQRLTALATALTQALERVSIPHASKEMNGFGKTRKRRLAAAVEYGASGRYVLINQTAGELLVSPNSAEWFTWLASLTLFLSLPGQIRPFHGTMRTETTGECLLVCLS
jgi:hypothetical protein